MKTLTFKKNENEVATLALQGSATSSAFFAWNRHSDQGRWSSFSSTISSFFFSRKGCTGWHHWQPVLPKRRPDYSEVSSSTISRWFQSSGSGGGGGCAKLTSRSSATPSMLPFAGNKHLDQGPWSSFFFLNHFIFFFKKVAPAKAGRVMA